MHKHRTEETQNQWDSCWDCCQGTHWSHAPPHKPQWPQKGAKRLKIPVKSPQELGFFMILPENRTSWIHFSSLFLRIFRVSIGQFSGLQGWDCKKRTPLGRQNLQQIWSGNIGIYCDAFLLAVLAVVAFRRPGPAPKIHRDFCGIVDKEHHQNTDAQCSVRILT